MCISNLDRYKRRGKGGKVKVHDIKRIEEKIICPYTISSLFKKKRFEMLNK